MAVLFNLDVQFFQAHYGLGMGRKQGHATLPNQCK